MVEFSNELVASFSQTQKIISNENRIKILLFLNKNDSSWSGFMKKLDIRNPKLLQDYLGLLRENNLIQKNPNGLYGLTVKGKSMTVFYLDELSQFAKLQKNWSEK